jgi:hypothetical protein
MIKKLNSLNYLQEKCITIIIEMRKYFSLSFMNVGKAD